jgi:hypothetical protein
MVTQGIRSTEAHDKKHHPLGQAHTAVQAPTGTLVYVVCGWQGCAQRLQVDAAVWQAELARRREREASTRANPAARMP